MFSRAAEYALRAMTFLAMQPPGKLSGAREIARAEKVPMPFLWKILQNLARRRLIRSFKGLHGGYELACPARKINVEDIVRAMDNTEVVEGCVLGLAQCSEENPCPLHHSWKEVRTQLTNMMQRTTLADLAAVASRRKRLRR
ncbi:MAG TPA: Rrf2 family transcriptional regulator [Candidatus Xenobia bacterium]|nr:Rrf2 family transcriptional regulator [Candidatus Xenobia bacterium]